MVLFNYSTKELTAKIVYYGPGLCGKTTNLQFIHGNLPETVKGKMLSLATKTDRTLFFDFLPIDLGQIRGMKTRVQLYTVPGQVFYNETRKLVLKGADGIVFVADSQQQMLGANVESFKNLEENLRGHGMTLADMPHVIQFNKRDLPGLASIEEMNSSINRFNAPFYETVATTGIGVQDTLKAITKLVLLHLTKKYDPRSASAESSTAVGAPAKAPASAPAPMPAAAPPSAPSEGSIPLAAMPTVSPAEAPAEASTMAAPVASVASVAAERAPATEQPEFDESDIDGLVDEVEEGYVEPTTADEAAAAAGTTADTFEIDASGIEMEQSADDGDLSVDAPSPDAPSVRDRFEALEIDAPSDSDVPDPALAVDLDDAQAIGTMDDGPGIDLDSLEIDTPEPAPMAPIESSESTPTEAELEGSVRLTDVAGDDDLFRDPELDIARLEPGRPQSIVVPVELVGDDGARRRFRLSVCLQLDPAEASDD